jgi:hypothetical protein
LIRYLSMSIGNHESISGILAYGKSFLFDYFSFSTINDCSIISCFPNIRLILRFVIRDITHSTLSIILTQRGSLIQINMILNGELVNFLLFLLLVNIIESIL